MTKEEMIEAIYKEVGNYKPNTLYSIIEYSTENDTDTYLWSNNYLPVLIWDVLDWVFEIVWIRALIMNKSLQLWEKKRLPIEEQNIECIEYIFNLIEWKH